MTGRLDRRRTGALAILLLPALVVMAEGATAEDAALLLDFKAAFSNGDAVLASWTPGSDPCGWQGVSCNRTGAVTDM